MKLSTQFEMTYMILICLLISIPAVSAEKVINSPESTIVLNQEAFLTKTTTHSSSYLTTKANFTTVPGRELVAPTAFIPDTFPSPPLPPVFYFDFENPIETILSFCPSPSSCQEDNSRSTFGIGNKCCIPCDCSARCYIAGTCCAEMTNGYIKNRQLNLPYATIEEPCINTKITGGKYESNSSYLLLQHCHPDYKDNLTKRKCLHPKFELNELIPVYSLNSSRHYRNVFCAKCNKDAEDVLLWQTRLSCEGSEIITHDFQQVFDISSNLEFISSYPSCALVSDPPSNVKTVERCILEENIVSDCNMPILDNLCKQYYAPVKGGSIIYRNVFCMECASSSNYTGLYDICFRHNGMPQQFDSILAVNIKQNIAAESESTANNIICHTPKVYIDKIDACIHRTCAVTEIKVTSGECHKIFSKLMNIHLEYRVKLVYREFTTDTLRALELQLYNDYFMDVLGVTYNNVCIANVLDVNFSLGKAEVRAVYVTSAEVTNIKQLYKEYEDSMAAYNEKAKGNDSLALIEIDQSGVEPMLENSVAFLQFTGFKFSHHCRYPIAMTKLQSCDTINFQKDEFKILYNGNIIIDKLVFVPGEFVIRQTLNGTIKNVQVCLNDYVSRFTLSQKVTSAARYNGKSENEIFLLLCFLCVLSHLFHI